jgi:Uma2 family endonuclease
MQAASLTSPPVRTTGRRPVALVVQDPLPDEIDRPVDWSVWYLTDEEDMGHSVEQGKTVRPVTSSLQELANERGWTNILCEEDNFFAWIEAEPLVRVSPDAYLLDDPPPEPHPRMWETWRPGHKPPRWALEVVSEDWKKDDDDNPPKYAQLGTRELVIFDPHAAEVGANGNGAPVRVPLQVYRRGADGAFIRVYHGNGPARSEEIDAWLVVRREGVPRLRLARDAAGTDIVPTAEEAKRAAEAKLIEETAARRQAEEGRQQAEEGRRQAEARIRELEAKLRKLGG